MRASWSTSCTTSLACGRRFRVFNVVDDVTKDCLAAVVDTSISGRRVARELTALVEHRGKPSLIVSDRAMVCHRSEDHGEGHRVHPNAMLA